MWIYIILLVLVSQLNVFLPFPKSKVQLSEVVSTFHSACMDGFEVPTVLEVVWVCVSVCEPPRTRILSTDN